MNCVDLFAGAGGFSLGARAAGARVKLAIEHDRNAAATYRRNLCNGGEGPLLVEDNIRDLTPLGLVTRAFDPKDSCDLLLGGPPCQGFSAHRLNDTGVSDERNDLIHTYFEFVAAFAPTVFLMENVPGMLWPRHKAALDRFYAKGSEVGYDVLRPIIIDARDYGVPQRRKRVFILGVREGTPRNDFAWPPARTHAGEVRRRAEPGLSPWVACEAAFGPAPPEDPNDVHMRHGQALVEAFKRTPSNGGSRKASGRVLDCHRKHDGHNDVYGRIDPGKPAPTMTTACINPSKGRFVHPTLHHGITVRQAARMQTFPDDFVFQGGLMAAGEQVGNAVPVELARILIRHVAVLAGDAGSLREDPEDRTADGPMQRAAA